MYIYIYISVYTHVYIYTYMCRHPHGPPRDSFAPSVKTLGFEVAGWPAICATGVAGIYTYIYIYDKYIYIICFFCFVMQRGRASGLAPTLPVVWITCKNTRQRWGGRGEGCGNVPVHTVNARVCFYTIFPSNHNWLPWPKAIIGFVIELPWLFMDFAQRKTILAASS